jgi:hypothetical protein
MELFLFQEGFEVSLVQRLCVADLPSFLLKPDFKLLFFFFFLSFLVLGSNPGSHAC